MARVKGYRFSDEQRKLISDRTKEAMKRPEVKAKITKHRNKKSDPIKALRRRFIYFGREYADEMIRLLNQEKEIKLRFNTVDINDAKAFDKLEKELKMNWLAQTTLEEDVRFRFKLQRISERKHI